MWNPVKAFAEIGEDHMLTLGNQDIVFNMFTGCFSYELF